MNTVQYRDATRLERREAEVSPLAQAVHSGAEMAQRILVVDDEDSVIFAMREYFNAQGYQVDTAQELEEAEALLSIRPYQLLIADLRLTGIFGAEGLTLAEHVKARCPGTRTIILTAYGSLEVEDEAQRIGVDAFLHKPTPLPDVARIVHALLQSQTR